MMNASMSIFLSLRLETFSFRLQKAESQSVFATSARGRQFEVAYFLREIWGVFHSAEI